MHMPSSIYIGSVCIIRRRKQAIDISYALYKIKVLAKRSYPWLGTLILNTYPTYNSSGHESVSDSLCVHVHVVLLFMVNTNRRKE